MSLGSSVVRKTGATIFLTSEDEWYKAAYFNGTSYFDYPAGSDAQTGCVGPSGDTGNSANCNGVMGDLTNVGAYSLSESPYDTFDQGGNVWEWNEAIIGSLRGLRGGSFGGLSIDLAASYRVGSNPANEGDSFGFRVAMIPEPSTALLLACGLAGLAAVRRGRRS
jgi:formylglycine-generating enzyme required for sulfatase activity